MSRPIPEEYQVLHYPNAWEREADRIVHITAISLAGGGAVWLVSRALTSGRPGLIAAAALYGSALVCMLAFSALYNFSRISPARPFLRRLDEAGIFLMIAGSYTPFTTQSLSGAWSMGMTALVWSIAIGGIVGKLAFPKVSEKVWTGVYVLFGWVAVVALGPLSHSLSLAILWLLLAGGVAYTVGSGLFLIRSLPFRRAVWHGCVCAGATLHYAAIAAGVVLAPAMVGAHTHG